MKPTHLSRKLLLAAYEAGRPRRFEIEAYDGGPLPVSGYRLPVIVDLETLQHPEAMPLVVDHEVTVEATLGSTDTIENKGDSLRIAGIVTATFPKPVAVIEQADKGQRWQASIGVRIGTLQEIQAGQQVAINRQVFRGPVFVARDCQMYETSVLPAGADWTTQVNLAASAALLKGSAAMPTFEEWLAAKGVDPAKLDDVTRGLLTTMYDAERNPPPVAQVVSPAPAPMMAQQPQQPAPVVNATAQLKLQEDAQNQLLAAMRTTQANEHRRIAEVEKLTVGHPDIRATAIEKAWSPLETEVAVLKAAAKQTAPSNSRRPGTSVVTPMILEAAICQSRKLPGHEKMFDDQTLQAAHTQFRGGIGLQQLLLQAAASNGYSVGAGERIGNGNIRSVLKAAFPETGPDLHAAFSTVSLPGLLSNIANKELLAGYESDESLMLWKEIAAIKSVSDFKAATSYRMLDNAEYEELGPGGKIKSGTLGEESYTRQAKTYAKLFKLTRTDIVNDDLGAFDDLRQRLGLGAATKLSNVFWTKFLDNSAFFTAARGNYITGSTTNLGTDAVGLQLGLNAFRTLRSPAADGSKRLGGDPSLLLVPTELAYVAEAFYVNLNLGGGTTVANANIHAKKYRPIVVPWLSDSSFSGYSATAWYLLRDKNRYAPMVVSFLGGVETPTVETAEADFDELGVQFRGYHDFGCDQAEYAAGVKSKGAA